MNDISYKMGYIIHKNVNFGDNKQHNVKYILQKHVYLSNIFNIMLP